MTAESHPDLLAAATDCFDRGDVAGCLEQIARLRARDGEAIPADAAYFEALCQRKLGRLEQAVALLDEALQLQPAEPDYLAEKGLALIEQGQVQPGLDVLREAVHASHHAPEFRHELYLQNALALYNEGYLEAAALSLKKALKFAQDRDTYRILTQVLVEWGHPDQALEVISEGLQRFPQDARLHHTAGLALAVSRRPYEAARAFVRAYELDPTDPEPVHSLALIFETSGDDYRAIETLERCRALMPGPEMSEDVEARLMRLRAKVAEAGMAAAR